MPLESIVRDTLQGIVCACVCSYLNRRNACTHLARCMSVPLTGSLTTSITRNIGRCAFRVNASSAAVNSIPSPTREKEREREREREREGGRKGERREGVCVFRSYAQRVAV